MLWFSYRGSNLLSSWIILRTPLMLMLIFSGTGKSQFLKFAAKLSNRSVITTGLGSTSAGLTVTAVKDAGTYYFLTLCLCYNFEQDKRFRLIILWLDVCARKFEKDYVKYIIRCSRLLLPLQFLYETVGLFMALWFFNMFMVGDGALEKMFFIFTYHSWKLDISSIYMHQHFVKDIK